MGRRLERWPDLNLYVADPKPALIRKIESEIEQAWSREACPTLTLIPSPIPGGASVAADAVIAVPMNDDSVTRFGNSASVVPPGRDILYVSGRVGSGGLAAATTETMRQLFDVLTHLGSTRADVVQVKAFIQPMSRWETVQLQIDRAFGDASSPPVVYVAWTSPLTRRRDRVDRGGARSGGDGRNHQLHHASR